MGIFSKKSKVKQLYDMDKKELGSGNFAKVFRAVKKKDNSNASIPEIVAIKVIDKSKVEDMGDIERECELMEKIAHPNIIKLFEVLDEDKVRNLVMELVTGGELFDAIVERGNYTEKDAAQVMGTMCDALRYLHAQDIVHRDLKPENILLAYKPTSKDPSPPIKIADFGLARLMSKNEMMKTACGTPGYVAPEVLKNKGYDSGAVDMWSTGVILYILLCGFPPFYEEELPALFDQILKGRYDFPSPWWDTISPGAKQLVTRLLTVDPKARLTADGIVTCASGKEKDKEWAKWMMGMAPSALIDTTNLKKLQASKKLKAAAKKIMAAQKFGNIAKLTAAAKNA